MVYIAKNATVVGDVELGENVNIWYGAVLRGDCGKITIGEGSNVQDNSVLHEKVTMGKGCTVGHGAILHGCTIGDNCLIGMGAIVSNDSSVGLGDMKLADVDGKKTLDIVEVLGRQYAGHGITKLGRFVNLKKPAATTEGAPA